MSKNKKFKDLTIRDNFMFSAVMMQEDNCKRFLEMLLGIKIKEIDVSYERSIIYNPECKGIRLDVYASDDNNTRYNIEMQVAEQKLGKRIRYYHSQMDMELLEKGQKYKELPTSYVIFICNFDPYKMGRYCYTFEKLCVEEKGLKLGDDSVSIVLSTEGKNDDVPKELKDFLKFIKNDNSDNNSKTDNEYVRQLQRSIRSVKENRKWEHSFMTLEEIKNEAVEENLKECTLDILSELGDIPKEIEEIVMAEFRMDRLKAMLRIAAKTTSFSDFKESLYCLE